MDTKIVESQLRNHKIREGPMYKRTKFLLQWRQRWMVLTMNFIFVFSNKTLKEVIEYIDLRQIKNYKSYVRKEDEMIPTGIKIRTNDDMYYFCARNISQKWSWMVSIERLMDFKISGKSPYNNIQWVSTKGFSSQAQMQRNLPELIQQDAKQKEAKHKKQIQLLKKQMQEYEKIKGKEKQMEAKQRLQIQKLRQQLEQSLQKVRMQEKSLLQKQKALQQRFAAQMNKIRESLPEGGQRERIVQVIVEKKVQVIVEKRVQVIVEKIVQKIVQVIVQKPVSVYIERPMQLQRQPSRQPQIKPQSTVSSSQAQQSSSHRNTGHRVSEIKKFYEHKIQESKDLVNTKKMSSHVGVAKEEKLSKVEFLHLCRDRVVVNLFEQFHSKAFTYSGLKYILQFLIKVGSYRGLGYQQYLVREAKSHENRFVFAQVFLQWINGFTTYKDGQKLSKLIQVLIFEAPGIFRINHFDLIKKKLLDIYYNCFSKEEISSILKTVYLLHKMKKYEKDGIFKEKLDATIISESPEQAKMWARKLLEDQ